MELNEQIAAERIHFNGLTFDLNGSRSRPREAQLGTQNAALSHNSNLLEFLDTLHRNGLLDNGPTGSGIVVYAED